MTLRIWYEPNPPRDPAFYWPVTSVLEALQLLPALLTYDTYVGNGLSTPVPNEDKRRSYQRLIEAKFGQRVSDLLRHYILYLGEPHIVSTQQFGLLLQLSDGTWTEWADNGKTLKTFQLERTDTSKIWKPPT